MKPRKLRQLLCFLLVGAFFIMNSLQAQPEPTGRRLRTIVADKYPNGEIIIGGTTGQHMFGTETGVILDREYSYVTPENDFKQPQIHPDNETWTWTKPDAWVDHISSNGQILRMHGPIGPQASTWAKTDSRTAAELETNMRDFMQALCQRYNGTSGFEYLDVVNETVVGNGDWHEDKAGTDKWECPWFKIGQDNDANQTPLYIKYAFEIATEYAPDIKLIYNHHENTINTTNWDLIKETIAYLRNQNLRVDGIGWQAHVNNGWATTWEKNKLKDLIDWAHQNNLEFHITENSVWLKNGNSQPELELQATTYSAIIDILLEKRSSGKVGWNTWHIADASTSSHPEWYPSLFGLEYEAKPAYYAVQEVLEEGPSGGGSFTGDGTYNIVNVGSNMPIRPDGGSTATNINIQQEYSDEWGDDWKTWDSFQWEIASIGDYYNITNKNSGKPIRPDGGSEANDINIQQEYSEGWGDSWKTWPAFQFEIVENGDYYNIINRKSGKPIRPDGGSTANDINIQQEYSEGWGADDSFKWIIEKPPLGKAVANEGTQTQCEIFSLAQNYPNPFNPTTVIRYNIPNNQHVELEIFDILGRSIDMLVNKEQSAGSYRVLFDGNDLSSGIYIYRLKAGSFAEKRKMFLLK